MGGRDNITGFVVSPEGRLSRLSNSTRPLSSDVTAPAQIKFTENGRVLVATEKATNDIDTYVVGEDGRTTGPIVTASAGQTPFGFYAANGNQIFVSDDFNDAAGAGALSSYKVANDGSLQPVSLVVPSNKSGACWVVVSPKGSWVYVSNTVDNTVSLYAIDKEDGSLRFDQSFPSPFSPADVDISNDGRFLYVLHPDEKGQGSPGINVFRINRENGSLTPVGDVSGLPTSIDGLVAR